MHVPCLTALDINHNKIGPAGTGYLSTGLRSATGLAVLKLSRNGVSDSGAKYLALRLLPYAPRLSSLELASNNICNDGDIQLAGALLQATTLRLLDLSFNKISGAVAERLVAAQRVARAPLDLNILCDSPSPATVLPPLSSIMSRHDHPASHSPKR